MGKFFLEGEIALHIEARGWVIGGWETSQLTKDLATKDSFGPALIWQLTVTEMAGPHYKKQWTSKDKFKVWFQNKMQRQHMDVYVWDRQPDTDTHYG